MTSPRDTAEKGVRALYAKVAAADFEGVLSLLADDAEFVQATGLPFGGRFVGRAGFSEMAGRIVAAWPGFAVKAEAFLSDGEDRVVVVTERSGQGLHMPMLELWTVRDGLISRCQPFYFDTASAMRTAVPPAAQ